MRVLDDRSRTSDTSSLQTEVLIREARRLRHRRWLIGSSLMLIAGAGIGVGTVVAGAGGGHRGRSAQTDPNPPTPVVALQPGVTMLNLTKSDRYGDIALVGTTMILYGPANQESDPSSSATCNSAVVNPSTLKLTSFKTSSCADPALEGQRVLPVMRVERNTPFGKGGVATITLRISRVVSGSPGYRLGPVVMTFPQESNGWPTWIYGDGDLWLFDALAANGSELLRVSGSTGNVLQRISMPMISRPIIAFDVDGLWFAPAVNSLGIVGAVYHLTPGAPQAKRVFSLPTGQSASWMVAAGHSVWIDVGEAHRTLWQLNGTSAVPAWHVQISSELENVVMTQGGASGIVGNAPDGLWAAVPTTSGVEQQVVRLDPSSAASTTTVAVLRPSYSDLNSVLYGAWTAVTFHGSMYLLDPPTTSGIYPYRSEGFSALYRVMPNG